MNKLINLLILSTLNFSFAGESTVADCTGTWRELRACELKFEHIILENHNNLIKREGDTLVLTNIKGSRPSKVIVDDSSRHIVVAHYSDQSITLIRLTGHEYSDMYAYHHIYGKYFQVFGNVSFSSSGRYMVAYNWELETSWAPNSLAVYELGTFPELRVRFDPYSFGFKSAKFDQSENIEIETVFMSPKGYETTTCKLIKFEKLWQFADINCPHPELTRQ